MARIGFVGTGAIAAPMARFLAARGHALAVTRRSEAVSARLAETCGARVLDAPGVLEESDVVVLSVRPWQAEEALAGLPWRAGHRIVSVMAAVPEARLRALCAPAGDVARTIPLAFLERGGCPLPAFGNAALLEELFAPENPVIPVDAEEALDAHFAVTASVAGILDLLAAESAWLAERTGDAGSAERYVAQLVSGFLGAMEKGPGRLAAGRDALATEGTLSLRAVEALRAGGAREALRRALDAAEEGSRAA